MVPRPATAPDRIPSTEGLPRLAHSTDIQTSAATAAEMWVLSMAEPASSPEANAEPALKPNQPTHSSEVPIRGSTGVCGAGARELCVEQGRARELTRGQRRARIEAEPADPQQRGADQGEHEVVRRHVFDAVTLALADHQAADNTRHGGLELD